MQIPKIGLSRTSPLHPDCRVFVDTQGHSCTAHYVHLGLFPTLTLTLTLRSRLLVLFALLRIRLFTNTLIAGSLRCADNL
jgi:hypothetical protein